jgi:hypothetical protein
MPSNADCRRRLDIARPSVLPFLQQESFECTEAGYGQQQHHSGGSNGVFVLPVLCVSTGYDVFGPQLGHYGDMQHPTELLGAAAASHLTINLLVALRCGFLTGVI